MQIIRPLRSRSTASESRCFIALVAVLCLGAGRVAWAQDSSWFTEVTDGVGLTGRTGTRIAAVDVNGDVYPDLILWNDHSTSDDLDLTLLLNVLDPTTGDRKFVDATLASGLNDRARPASVRAGPARGKLPTQGRMNHTFALADVNNDGAPDFVSCISWYHFNTFVDHGDRCELLLNDGQGHFTIKDDAGLRELGLFPATGMSFLDYDLDGNIDLYIATFLQNYDTDEHRPDFLLRGHGDGTFTDVTQGSGIDTDYNWNPKYGLNIVDINNDHYPDVLTSPYCRSEGMLFINDQHGGFTDQSDAYGYQTSHGLNRQDSANPLLCQWAANPWDYDNDGDMDLVQVLVHGGWGDTQGRTFVAVNGGAAANYALTASRDLIVRKAPRPTHLGDYYGVWFDMDNNGWVDLAITQATYTPGQDRLYMELQDASHVLQDVTSELGMLSMLSPHAFVALDYDLDGDEDFAVGLQMEGARVHFFRNNIGSQQHWVKVKLEPPAGVNQSAVGARVEVKTPAFTQTRDVYAGEGNFVGVRPFEMNFGLGAQTRIDSITVTWPNQAHSIAVLENVAVDQVVTIRDSPPTSMTMADAGCAQARRSPRGATGLWAIAALVGLAVLRRRGAVQGTSRA